jgi:hypothetical protein
LMIMPSKFTKSVFQMLLIKSHLSIEIEVNE